MATLVNDDLVKKRVLFYLNNFWNCNYTDFVFPLPNSVYIGSSKLNQIKNGFKFLIKNTAAKRAIFLLYKNHEDENKQYLIFKDGSILETKIICDESYYEGTMFDVCYLNDKINISDTSMLKGLRVYKNNYSERYNFAVNFCNTCLKDMGLNKIYDNISEINLETNEEVYIISEKPLITADMIGNFYKWRDPRLVNFYLSVKERENHIDLYTTNFKIPKLFAKITGKLVEEIKNLDNYKNECIVNVNLDKDDFIIDAVCKDSTYPTSIRTIENIIRFKQENLQLCDLIS